MLRTILLSVLSVTLVYCGQTVGWIRMLLGMEVGLNPLAQATYCARWGPSSPMERDTASPTFWAMSIVAKRSPSSSTAELLFC